MRTVHVRPVVQEVTTGYDFERRFLHSFEMRDNGRYVVTVHNGRVQRVERAETVLSPEQLANGVSARANGAGLPHDGDEVMLDSERQA